MRQPVYLSPCLVSKKGGRTTIATNQKFHLQPFATVRKPPMMGPTQGPTATGVSPGRIAEVVLRLTWSHHPYGHRCAPMLAWY